MDGFDAFWVQYPRHLAKKDARKAWDRMQPSAALTEQIIRAIAAQIRDRQRKAARREWVPEWPYPATWLRGERWLDETHTVPTRPTRVKPGEEIDLV